MVHDVVSHVRCRGTAFEDVAQAFAYVGNVAQNCGRSALYPACRFESDSWCFGGARTRACCKTIKADEAETSSSIINPLSFELVGAEAFQCSGSSERLERVATLDGER